MGRKLRGAALRAKKRGNQHATELVETEASVAEHQAVVEKSNEELFVIDTTGDKKAMVPPQLRELPTKKQLLLANNNKESSTKNNNNKKSTLPLLDQQRVDKLVEKHDAEKLQVMVKEGQAKMKGDRRAQRKRGKFDLWSGDEEKEDDTKNNPKNKKYKSANQHIKDANAKADKVHQIGGVTSLHLTTVAEPVSRKPQDAVAVEVAHGGQSYRPDPEHYKAVVQDAVSLELRRQEAQDHAKAPLAQGMSAETLALLVGDSSSDDEEDDDDDEQDKNNNTIVLRKRPEKLTRAERNKQKRLRREKAIEKKRKLNKKLLNSVAEIPKFKKDMKKHHRELEEKKAKLEEEKNNNKQTPGKNIFLKISERDPIHAPTLPVALEAEHKDGSLRTIIPKGSLATDRMASFVDRSMLSKRKMGDKKRVMQGKRRKLNVKGKGHELAKAMDYALMG